MSGVTPFLLVLVLAAAATPSPAAGQGPGGAGRASALLVSPRSPRPGAPLRILASFEAAFRDARVVVSGPEGALKPLRTRRGGGPPYWFSAEFLPSVPGRYSITVETDGRPAAGAAASVVAQGPPVARSPGVWRSERGWTRADENLYSAWLEALFQDCDERASWPSLHDAVDDRGRNVLFDHLGLGEDDPGGPNRVEMTPDCADNPFYLRAYFAWKTGLPFGYFSASWGSLAEAPRALNWRTNDTPAASGAGPAQAFGRLLLSVKDAVHAGNGRTAFGDDRSDYYPLPLTRKDLRPGAVFADPYGHTLTVVRWVPQAGKASGLLLAVDAQPDGTIGIKRFWEGNFCFNTREVVGEPGFKAFRPIVVEGGRARLLSNDEVRRSPDYGNYSLEQERMASETFYATMERLINPDLLDAPTALAELVRALHEQLIVRVDSVALGDKYMAAHPGTVIPMPAGGSAVFQTTGIWEDFSTPNRDLRLLIAIDTVLDFPDKVARNPKAYGLAEGPAADAVKGQLLALQKKMLAELSITYTRSDGKPEDLTLAQVIERKEALEMAYNPNDCAEVRWGAPPGSPEMAACRRRAPAYQADRMKAMRVWFQKRLHPAT